MSNNPWSAPHPEETLLSILSEQGITPDPATTDISSDPSLGILRALSEISSLSGEIHAAELALLSRNLHRDNREVVGVVELERVEAAAAEITQTLQSVLEDREGLAGRLRAPHDSGRLVIEARYQGHAVATFEKLGRVLASLTGSLRSVEEYQNSGLSEERLVQTVETISGLCRSVRTIYDGFQSEHTALSELNNSVGMNKRKLSV
eukprot:sb/3470436/